MTNVASAINTNSRDLDPVVTSGGTVMLKRGRGSQAVSGISTTSGALEVLPAAGSTGTLTNVAGSASSVTVLAANSGRFGATIVNDSSALLYLKFGSTASTTSYTVVLAGAASAPFAYYEVPFGYTGIITGIWASATGNARVTEVTL